MNYWKTVLVSLLIAALLGGAFVGVPGVSNRLNLVNHSNQNIEVNGDFSFSQGENGEIVISGGDGSVVLNPDGSSTFQPGEDVKEDVQEFQEFVEELGDSTLPGIFGVFFFGVLLVMIFLVAALALVVNALLFNPLEVGGRRFFVQNLHLPAEVKEVAFGYDHCYKNNVKTLFFRDLYTVLWGLLFIIPGIIKAYEYRMMPYILAAHPDMPTKEVFARSKEMMRGNKWRAFVLDLSFIGWELLSALTLGILHIFYVGPYRNMTNAALYEALEYGNRPAEGTVWTQQPAAPVSGIEG
ncbi:MAG: DUF975 family protein [Firmicutes bacterium]|nr:DUF975 family protein [Bacillota bacterium]